MNCPYCGKLMEEGVIQSPHEISWKNERKLLGRAMFHEDAIILSKLAFIRGSAVIAYRCSDCEKIVIDYKDGNSEANESILG